MIAVCSRTNRCGVGRERRGQTTRSHCKVDFERTGIFPRCRFSSRCSIRLACTALFTRPFLLNWNPCLRVGLVRVLPVGFACQEETLSIAGRDQPDRQCRRMRYSRVSWSDSDCGGFGWTFKQPCPTEPLLSRCFRPFIKPLTTGLVETTLDKSMTNSRTAQECVRSHLLPQLFCSNFHRPMQALGRPDLPNICRQLDSDSSLFRRPWMPTAVAPFRTCPSL